MIKGIAQCVIAGSKARARELTVALQLGLMTLSWLGHAAAQGSVVHIRHGDTVIVRTTGNGLWGPTHDAIEVKRIGGASRETTFGNLDQIAALPNGGVLVLDTRALDGPALRMFDRDGRFVRNVGRRGNGPGEFAGDGTSMIRVSHDGSFMLRRIDGVVNRYRADGTFLNSFRFDAGAGGRMDVYPGPQGTAYIRGGSRPNTDMAQVAVRRYDTAGAVLDSLIPASYLLRPPATNSAPLEWWVPLSSGEVVASRTDRLGFLLRSGPGLKTLLLADVPAEGPAFLPEERAERQAVMDFTHDLAVQRGSSSPRQAMAERKLVLARSDIEIGFDGRVWLRRSATGIKGEPHVAVSGRMPDGTFKQLMVSFAEPIVLSAFRLDGAYLGDVRFPRGSSVMGAAIVGDFAWAATTDPDGTPYLVKYRVR